MQWLVSEVVPPVPFPGCRVEIQLFADQGNGQQTERQEQISLLPPLSQPSCTALALSGKWAHAKRRWFWANDGTQGLHVKAPGHCLARSMGRVAMCSCTRDAGSFLCKACGQMWSGEPFGSGGRGGNYSEGRAQGGGPWQKARRRSSVSGVAGDYEGDGRLTVRVSMGRGLASR